MESFVWFRWACQKLLLRLWFGNSVQALYIFFICNLIHFRIFSILMDFLNFLLFLNIWHLYVSQSKFYVFICIQSFQRNITWALYPVPSSFHSYMFISFWFKLLVLLIFTYASRYLYITVSLPCSCMKSGILYTLFCT